MPGYDPLQGNNMKPSKVSICTSANVINVQCFIDELPVKYPDLALDVQYFELPYNDIDNFTFKREDVGIMILCHSINNRRFAITDVMDALYDRFLPYSAKILGKDRICVVAHDFQKTKGLDKPDKYEAEMEIFKRKQCTTFKESGLVMMGGKLGGPVELQESNWEQLREFLRNAARSPMPEAEKSWWQRFVERHSYWSLVLLISLAALACIAIGLGVGLGDSSTTPVSSTIPTSTRPTPSTTTTPTIATTPTSATTSTSATTPTIATTSTIATTVTIAIIATIATFNRFNA